jgi:hypothetical protein
LHHRVGSRGRQSLGLCNQRGFNLLRRTCKPAKIEVRGQLSDLFGLLVIATLSERVAYDRHLASRARGAAEADATQIIDAARPTAERLRHVIGDLVSGTAETPQ